MGKMFKLKFTRREIVPSCILLVLVYLLFGILHSIPIYKEKSAQSYVAEIVPQSAGIISDSEYFRDQEELPPTHLQLLFLLLVPISIGTFLLFLARNGTFIFPMRSLKQTDRQAKNKSAKTME